MHAIGALQAALPVMFIWIGAVPVYLF